MNEIMADGVAKAAHQNLLHEAESVITVDKGRGFVIRRKR